MREDTMYVPRIRDSPKHAGTAQKQDTSRKIVKRERFAEFVENRDTTKANAQTDDVFIARDEDMSKQTVINTERISPGLAATMTIMVSDPLAGGAIPTGTSV